MSTAAPHVVVIAGPNGSGKSTLTRSLRLTALLGFEFPANYVNADEIAAELRLAHDPDPEVTAFHQGRELRRAFREQHVSFAYETVLSYPSGLVELQRLRDAGYRLTLVCVTTADPELNVARIEGRVQAGGHHVPEDRVYARYERFFQFLPRAVETAHDTWIFDATAEIELCLRANDGAILPGGTAPPYLQQRLAETLSARAVDRQKISLTLGSAVCLTAVDENSGVYRGPILVALPTLPLQQTSEGTYVIHDASLLKEDRGMTEPVCIRYREGYAELEH